MQSGKIHLSARICCTASVTRQIYSQKHIQTGEASLVEWSISKTSLNGMKKGNFCETKLYSCRRQELRNEQLA